MFCYQCEQAALGVGCDRVGVCGKQPGVSDLQDILVATAMGVAWHAVRTGNDQSIRPAGRFVVQALFTTVTNVAFDVHPVSDRIKQGIALRDSLSLAVKDRQNAPRAATFGLCASNAAMQELNREFGIRHYQQVMGEDKAGVLFTILYGLKGAAAYADHAMRLGREDDALYSEFLELLSFAATEPQSMDELLQAALRAGALNLNIMALLDQANTGTYGHPTPVQVRITPVEGKAILVTGHDLKDLHDLLEATKNTGINIYTHGEMLPCHGYPELKKYPHLVGNYGGAWQEQQKEFDQFPGPILFTTNCLMPPRPTYSNRVFTTGLVSFPGCTHVENGQSEPVIAAALASEGFAYSGPEQCITVGFGHNAVLNVADKVVEAVKSGAIKHFFLIGGCDGAKPGRNYYTEFAEKTPPDSLILTLACGKYRFNKKDFGTVAGLPRLLDIGQCNDAFSAIRIASALAEAFKCGVNDLPLSFILSWYEQKAVAILLTLFHLGIRNIRLGPTLPAFITPAVLDVLVDKFAITPVTTAEADLQAILT